MKRVIILGSLYPDLRLEVQNFQGKDLQLDKSLTFQGTYSEDQGGKGAHQSVAAKQILGNQGEVYLISGVGKDYFGKLSLDKIRRNKIKTRYIKVFKEIPTGRAIIYIFSDGVKTVGLVLGPNTSLTKKDIYKAKQEIKKSNAAVSQIENSVSRLCDFFKLAKKFKVPTFLDPSLIPEGVKEKGILFKKIFPLTDFLMPDRQEAQLLTGVKPLNFKSYKRIARQLLSKKVKFLILTLGDKGLFFATKNFSKIIPAVKVKAKDATAAGDIFRGSFVAHLVKHYSNDMLNEDNVLKSLRFANKAAALSVSKLGSFSSIPTLREINSFIKTS